MTSLLPSWNCEERVGRSKWRPAFGRGAKRKGLCLFVLLAIPFANGCASLDAARERVAGVILVANRRGNSASIVDAASMVTLATIPVGRQPHEAAISPDCRTGFISNYGGGSGSTISIVDLETRRTAGTIDTSTLTPPHGLVAGNGTLWFTAEGRKAVARYAIATKQFDWIGKTDENLTHMLAVRSDGSAVYTANIESDSVSIIPVGTKKFAYAEWQVPVVHEPEGIALSPDQRELWVGSRSDGGIAIVDTATARVVATIAKGSSAYRLVFAGDGRLVVVARERSIVLYDATRRTEVRSISMPGFVLSMAAMPGSDMVIVTTAEPDAVHSVDLRSGSLRTSVSVGPIPDGVAYCPNWPPR